MNLRRLVASVSLDAGAYVRELEERVKKLEMEYADLEAEHNNLASKLFTMRAERDTLRAQVAELEAVDAGHASELLRMQEALNEANARIDALLRRECISEGQLPLVGVPDAPPPAPPQVVSDSVQRRVYQVVKLALNDGYKWFFTDGGSESFNAPILDEDFHERMNRREVLFAHGDALEVDVRIVSTRQGMKFRTTYEIVRVHRHLVPDEQPSFPFTQALGASASEGVTS